MGGSRFDAGDWKDYASTASTRSYSDTFARKSTKTTKDPRTSFNPITIMMRESRDSAANPNSTAIILAFDETGSMGSIPYHFIKEGLGKLMTEIYDRKPVPDPHIMVLAVGDVEWDRAPLQATQFEADITIAKQIEDLYLEGGGGGNRGESYNAAHYFAATKTSIDCFEKRGKKGLLFTIGDEPPLPILKKTHIQEFIGGEPTKDLTSQELVDMASHTYDVFHVIVEEGYFRGQPENVLKPWHELLPQGRILRLKDHTKLAEVIVSAIQIHEGADRDTVIKSWSGGTDLVVRDAISTDLVAKKEAGSEIVHL